MSSKVKYDGTIFRTGDLSFILPPCTAKDAQNLSDHLDVIGKPLVEGETLKTRLTDHYIPLIHAMLKKNYPEIDVDTAAEFISLDKLIEMLGAIMGSDKTAKVNVLPPTLGENQPVESAVGAK